MPRTRKSCRRNGCEGIPVAAVADEALAEVILNRESAPHESFAILAVLWLVDWFYHGRIGSEESKRVFSVSSTQTMI